MISQTGKIQSEANRNILLRQKVSVNQQFADLVGGIGIFIFVGVVVLEQKLAVAVLDYWLGVALDLGYDAEDLGDLDAERRPGAVEEVAVGVDGFVAVVHELGVGADLAVVTGDESEEASIVRSFTMQMLDLPVSIAPALSRTVLG